MDQAVHIAGTPAVGAVVDIVVGNDTAVAVVEDNVTFDFVELLEFPGHHELHQS